MPVQIHREMERIFSGAEYSDGSVILYGFTQCKRNVCSACCRPYCRLDGIQCGTQVGIEGLNAVDSHPIQACLHGEGHCVRINTVAATGDPAVIAVGSHRQISGNLEGCPCRTLDLLVHFISSHKLLLYPPLIG